MLFYTVITLLSLYMILVTPHTFNDNCEIFNIGITCKPIKECDVLYSLLNSPSPEIISYLRKSHCGFSGKQPKVCCPKSPPKFKNETNLLHSKKVCGMQSEDRLIGGESVQIDNYRWTALLVSQKGKKKVFCGGTLISDRYILTAAHCLSRTQNFSIEPKSINVRFGEYNTKTDPDCVDEWGSLFCLPPVVEASIEDVIIHEEFNPQKSMQNDIAIIRINKTISFNDFIDPICLPVNVNNTNKNYAALKLIRAGWGVNSSDISQSIKLRGEAYGQSQEECDKIFGFNLSHNQFCVIKHQSYSSCVGDTGGFIAEMDRSKGQYFLAGIASLGSCDNNQATLYTKVENFIDWIVSNMKI